MNASLVGGISASVGFSAITAGAALPAGRNAATEATPLEYAKGALTVGGIAAGAPAAYSMAHAFGFHFDAAFNGPYNTHYTPNPTTMKMAGGAAKVAGTMGALLIGGLIVDHVASK